jgi:hypothetical protein
MSENAQAKKNTQENSNKSQGRGRVESPKVRQRTFDTATDLQSTLAGPNHEEEPSHFLTPAASDLAGGESGSLLQRQPSAPVPANSNPATPSFKGWNFSHIPPQASNRTPIQPKLMVGPANDQYEQEADETAARVMSMPSRVATMSQDGQGVAQRQDEDELAQMKPQLIQRDSAAGFATDEAFETNLNRQRGSGTPLPASLRADFEPKFGADFSGVRVHTNDQSHQLNQSIQAKAFTTGQDVFFRQGAYEPGSRGGQELIAHELTHVVQQGGAGQRTMDAPKPVDSPRPLAADRTKINRLYVKEQEGGPVAKVKIINEPPEWKYGMDKNKHIAKDEDEAKEVTHARYISDKGGGGKRVRRGDANTVAEAQYWIAAVRTNKEDVVLGIEQFMNVQPIGWEVTRTGDRKDEMADAKAVHNEFKAEDYSTADVFMPRKIKVKVTSYDSATKQADVAMGHVADQD